MTAMRSWIQRLLVAVLLLASAPTAWATLSANSRLDQNLPDARVLRVEFSASGELHQDSSGSCGWTAAECSVAPSNLPSVNRLSQPGETFFHYGYAEDAVNFQGGLRPGGFATPNPNLSGQGAQGVLNLAPGRVPRNAMYPVQPVPGTPIIGPRPVVGGSGYEVLFPNGTAPGTIGPPTAVPLRPR